MGTAGMGPLDPSFHLVVVEMQNHNINTSQCLRALQGSEMQTTPDHFFLALAGPESGRFPVALPS